ncbi:MAG: peptidoglycan DD-metalloendopeptidase family protein [Desulfuromonadaceae bacterium]|nr:peptidoglycan DD-metalloendopeptidase family protein [Desulfuromonadaceae bacterium]
MISTSTRILLGTVVLLCFVIALPKVKADELQDTRRRLAAIAEQLQQAEAALRDNQGDVQHIFAVLEKLQTEQDRIGQKINALKRLTAQLTSEIATVNSAIKKMKKQQHAHRELLQKRLIVMYKEGNSGVLPILFGTEAADSVAEDLFFLRRIAASDQQLLNETRTRQQRLEREIAQLKSLEAEQQRTRTRLLDEQRELRHAEKIQQETLLRLESKGVNLRQTALQLRQQAEQLRALVKKLESSRRATYTPGTGKFARQRGRLKSPVFAPIKYGYGMRTLPGDGVLTNSNGLEFAVSAGQPVHAVWSGQVVFADTFRGFGKLLIIDHGDSYYSLYAHAEQLFKTAGEAVVVGERIARSTERCYFEIRHQGAPIDPQPWLQAQR